jgi:hypothetical protein
MSTEREDKKGILQPVLIAMAIGIGLWLAASLVGGKREPWDGPVYWVIAYPAGIIASAVLGYRHFEGAWRWPLVLFESQLIGAWIRAGEPGNLWPIAMVLFAVVSIPAIVAASIAARFGRRAAGEG